MPTPTNKDEETAAYFRGLKHGRIQVITSVRTILEESEQRISILTILARLDVLEQEVSDV